MNDEYPLHYASERGDLENIKSLIASGADVNASNTYCTPLHLAVAGDYFECSEYLLQSGADPISLTDTGMTPMHCTT
jgi:uncharacterized protein